MPDSNDDEADFTAILVLNRSIRYYIHSIIIIQFIINNFPQLPENELVYQNPTKNVKQCK